MDTNNYSQHAIYEGHFFFERKKHETWVCISLFPILFTQKSSFNNQSIHYSHKCYNKKKNDKKEREREREK